MATTKPTAEDVIDYERLINHFEETMLVKMRGHVAGVDYLEYWIPDADIVKSVLNMIDAAQAAGRHSIAVKIARDKISGDECAELIGRASKSADASQTDEDGSIVFAFANLSGFTAQHDAVADTASQSQAPRVKASIDDAFSLEVAGLDTIIDILTEAADAGNDTVVVPLNADWPDEGRRAVSAVLEAFGDIADDTDIAPGKIVELTGLQDAAVFRDLPMAYRRGVRRAAGDSVHAGRVAPSDELICLSDSDEGVELGLQIHPKTKRIRKAWFEGAANPVCHGVMEAFCSVAEGLPFQDASDYAGFKLLHAVRDFRLPRSRGGINMSVNVHPALDFPVRLIRRFHGPLGEFEAFKDIANFFEAPPSKAWIKSSSDERSGQIVAALKLFAESHGIAADAIQLSEITANKFGFPVRVTVSYSPDLAGRHLGDLTMTLERWLKDSVEDKLQVFCDEFRDQSKLRRLSENTLNKFT